MSGHTTESVVNENWPKLKRFFATKVPAAEAYDLAGDTLKVFLERDHSEIENLKSYLWGIARNKVRQYFDRRVQTGVFDSSSMSVIQMGTSLSSQVDKRAHLRRALATLPLDIQTAFELRYGEELSIDEVVGAMSVSRATVNRYLKIARESLRRELSAPEEDVVRAYQAG